MKKEPFVLSTSNEGSRFLIYVYFDQVEREPFYVGKTRVEKRIWDRCLSRRTKVFLDRLHVADRVSVVVLFSFTETQADLMERYLIREIGRKDLGIGPLVNLTDGGDSTNGYILPPARKKEIGDFHRDKVVSAETRMKMSVSHKGKPIWNKGRKHPLETIEKMRKASIGKKASAKTREKMRQSQLRRWEQKGGDYREESCNCQ